MSGFYVDNAMNRRLGRVGMPHGSMPHSRNSIGSSSSIGSLSSFDHLFGFTDHSSASRDVYADNQYNRRHDRAGLPMGSRPISKSGNSTHDTAASSSPRSNISNLSQHDSYADNAYNRRVGRAGMPMGTMPISKSEPSGSRLSELSQSTNQKVYADNEFNRRCGRVGLPVGTRVMSKAPETKVKGPIEKPSNSAQQEQTKSRVKSAPAKPRNEPTGNSPTTNKTYVDNELNRRLERVGLPLGTAKIGKSKTEKVYVDNKLNQSLDRVGKPVGTATYSRETNFIRQVNYVDNSLNRQLRRVGLPRGSRPVSRKSGTTKQISKLLDDMLRRRVGKELGEPVNQEDTHDYHVVYHHGDADSDHRLGDGLFGLDSTTYARDGSSAYEIAQCRVNRMLEEMTWRESHGIDESPKTTPEVLENYRGTTIPYTDLKLVSKIGQGGFGEVYYAEWQNSIVAVKKLKAQGVSKRSLRSFESEMMMLCQLDYPTIIKFVGACEQLPDLCIVMEYMDTSLFEALHLQTEVDFPEEARLSIIRQTCDGLTYLHSKGIAHCDLKSANVLLNYDGELECEVKISDFGVSVMKNNTQTSSTTANIAQNAGTPRYAAPEVLRGEMLKVAELMMADIYSLALVVYEVIYEEEPYYDMSYLQLIKLVGETGLTPDMPETPRIDRSFKAMIKKAWGFVPVDRPTAEQVLHTFLGSDQIYYERQVQNRH